MKKYNVLLFVFIVSFLKAQTPYIDVLTAPAMALYASQIKNEQEKTVDEMNKLQQAQAFVSTQMVLANDLQNKFYKGLKEVNGTLKNGIQVQNIYNNLTKIITNVNGIYDEVQDAPEYSVFAYKSVQLVTNKATDIYTDVADLLTSGELNLATSGDRRRLLFNIENNTRLMNVYLINVRWTIKRAKKKGFWRSINPFQTYVNTDKQIFQQILNNAGTLGL
ncbi:hypothetical protein HNP38_002566 [Chryseobacterium defluvii]|uniref:P-type conjugative transfer protein TrbJ n=1 Tax=Chryseobacterium defluvii TaxID=160396 RepID=A0A840KK72_9FLAO|nr:hypothetical protein [Chryseobacterium defluvii]MBB4807262.1 hypothetical protein [Chryseobacterium defluvii]